MRVTIKLENSNEFVEFDTNTNQVQERVLKTGQIVRALFLSEDNCLRVRSVNGKNIYKPTDFFLKGLTPGKSLLLKLETFSQEGKNDYLNPFEEKSEKSNDPEFDEYMRKLNYAIQLPPVFNDDEWIPDMHNLNE